jgi:N-methylhydantoinase B
MSARQPDPVTFEVIWHRLVDIAEEMGIKYMRTSGSPVLVGAYDASTAIMLPDGRLVAMGPYITTQGHVQRLIVEATLRLRSEVPGIRPGDMFICNDPYLGATHQPDVVTVAPLMVGDRILGWVGSSGHWLDIGGSEPGGFAVSATSVFDEGLRLPPTRLVEGGILREDMVQLIMAQIREPLAEFDLRGQVAANQWGLIRLAQLMDEYGEATVTSVMEASISYVKSRVRGRLAELPDGVWREVQYLDHDGQSANLRPIVCTVTKRGASQSVDFTGSAPQVRGFANCAYGGVRAATLSAVGIALGYDLPWNDGLAESVELIAPPGTVVTAECPTLVSLSTISAIIVALNLMMSTISKMLLLSVRHRSEATAAWCGTSLGISVSSLDPSRSASVLSEASHFAAGCGARSYADGVDTGGIIINTTAKIPSIEVTEAEYPVLYLFRRQLMDSGGPGRFRGGRSAGVALVPYGQDVAAETTFAGVGAEVATGVGIAGGLPGATVRYLRVANGVPASQPPWPSLAMLKSFLPRSISCPPIPRTPLFLPRPSSITTGRAVVVWVTLSIETRLGSLRTSSGERLVRSRPGTFTALSSARMGVSLWSRWRTTAPNCCSIERAQAMDAGASLTILHGGLRRRPSTRLRLQWRSSTAI